MPAIPAQYRHSAHASLSDHDDEFNVDRHDGLLLEMFRHRPNSAIDTASIRQHASLTTTYYFSWRQRNHGDILAECRLFAVQIFISVAYDLLMSIVDVSSRHDHSFDASVDFGISLDMLGDDGPPLPQQQLRSSSHLLSRCGGKDLSCRRILSRNKSHQAYGICH